MDRVVTPRDSDVLFGRGSTIAAHPGNMAFRLLVDARKHEFQTASKEEKRNIATQILKHIQREGRFLMPEDGEEGQKQKGLEIRARAWVVVGDKLAMEKTRHRLRENIGSLSSTQDVKRDDGSELTEDDDSGQNANSIGRRASSTSALHDHDRLQERRRSGSFGDGPPDSDHDDLESVLDGGLLQDLERNLHGQEFVNIDSILNEENAVGPDTNALQLDGSLSSRLDGSASSFGRQLDECLSNSCDSMRGSTTLHDARGLQQYRPTHGGDRGEADQLDDLNSLLVSNSGQEIRGPDTTTNLREWIDKNIPQGLYSVAELNKYTKAALPIAIKLAESLVDETDPGIGLSSCSEISIDISAAGDVTGVRARTSAHVCGELERLASLGEVFYELFSGLVLPKRKTQPRSSQEHLDTLNVRSDSTSRTLTDDDARQFKRRSSQVTNSSSGSTDGDRYLKLISSLDEVGIPASLSGLVKNLLDCSRIEFRGNESYSSFGDVLTDLKLVRDNPCCYLDSIGNSPTFFIPNKLYGRQEIVNKITGVQKHGAYKGLVVNGRAGVGKSSLLSQIFTNISKQNGSYFFWTKFEQSGINPLANVASLFNSLCDAFTRDAPSHALSSVENELELAIGVAGNIALSYILPSLSKILKSPDLDLTDHCMNQAASVSYSFRKLLEIISSHSAPITLLFDDVQFADVNSRSIISSLLSDTAQDSFFVCCYRDDDVKPGDELSKWLESLESCDIEKVEVENLTTEGVNEMVSESLGAFPRITLPLSTQLHAKTRGNPLFLRQLIDSLHHQGLVFLSLNPPRWAWDLDKISNVEMPVSVVALLIAEMQTLSPDLKQCLRVASCLGSTIQKEAISIIASGLNLNLEDSLDKLARKGFVLSSEKGPAIRFPHDKIQQSAYETMTVSEQRRLHLLLGSIMCDQEPSDEGFLFAAVTQANLGGVDTSRDPRKRVTIATFNYKAGTRAKEMSAFDIALGFFQNGILWIPDEESWIMNYSLSLALHVSAVETACLLNNLGVVTKLTRRVVSHARTYDEKLPCLFCLMKSLASSGKFLESRDLGFEILIKLGERLPREICNPMVLQDMHTMIVTLQSTTNEAIMDLKMSHQDHRNVVVLGIYTFLSHVLTEINPRLVPDITIRMMQITLNDGLSPISPIAFAMIAVALAGYTHNSLAYRMTKLAKRLVARPSSHRYASGVSLTTGMCLDWMFEPLQSVAENLLNGHTCGLQVGDLINAQHNYRHYIIDVYLGGKELSHCRGLFLGSLQKNANWGGNVHEACYYRMVVSLIEGYDFLDEFPSWRDLSNLVDQNFGFSLGFQAHCYMKSFLFQSFGDVMESESFLSRIHRKGSPMRPLLIIGVFYEGLLAFHMARTQQQSHLITRGNEALEAIKMYSQVNPYTFENKYCLLEASRLELIGSDQAGVFYQKAIDSARANKFPHEEALASEMAGRYLFSKGTLHSSSQGLYIQAIKMYQCWGAGAIAERVTKEMQQKFGTVAQHRQFHHATYQNIE